MKYSLKKQKLILFLILEAIREEEKEDEETKMKRKENYEGHTNEREKRWI